jgi:hypothetical protein
VSAATPLFYPCDGCGRPLLPAESRLRGKSVVCASCDEELGPQSRPHAHTLAKCFDCGETFPGEWLKSQGYCCRKCARWRNIEANAARAA